MHVHDLAPNEYSVPRLLSDVFATGWLATGKPSPIGEVEPDVLVAVERLVVTQRANPMRGMHECDLCTEARFALFGCIYSEPAT